VRFIAATNRDLANDVKTGRFREDLYYRLAVFQLVVPPLCDRKSEIEPLARKFLSDFAKDSDGQPPDISADALALLLRYDWPGNIRELRNVMERALALCPGTTITPSTCRMTRRPALRLARRMVSFFRLGRSLPRSWWRSAGPLKPHWPIAQATRPGRPNNWGSPGGPSRTRSSSSRSRARAANTAVALQVQSRTGICT